MANFFIYWVVALFADLTTVLYQIIRGRPLSTTQSILLVGLGASAAWRMLYWLVLYPKYFTPFRHLPTPPVSWAVTLIILTIKLTSPTSEPKTFDWQREWLLSREKMGCCPEVVYDYS